MLTRKEIISSHREKGGRAAAVFPVLYPRELFRAFGVIPVELWGPRLDPGSADRWLQSYICSIARSGIAFLEQKAEDYVDMILVPHACDSLQGLGSVLNDFFPSEKPILTLYYPRSKKNAATLYMADEIRSLAQKLEDITGLRPSLNDLNKCIEAEENADRVLAGLYRNKSDLKVSDRDFYAQARSREYLPSELFIKEAKRFIEVNSAQKKDSGGLDSKEKSGTENRIPLILSGVLPEPSKLLDIINNAGGAAVADDMIACMRRIPGEGKSPDPYVRMAERLLDTPPCSTRGDSVDSRLEHLLGLVKGFGAAGVIFMTMKFCEPEQFYLPELKAGLKRAGTRSLVLELDGISGLSHQSVTRVEAFLESLK